jgi:hypothetical protein
LSIVKFWKHGLHNRRKGIIVKGLKTLRKCIRNIIGFSYVTSTSLKLCSTVSMLPNYNINNDDNNNNRSPAEKRRTNSRNVKSCTLKSVFVAIRGSSQLWPNSAGNIIKMSDLCIYNDNVLNYFLGNHHIHRKTYLQIFQNGYINRLIAKYSGQGCNAVYFGENPEELLPYLTLKGGRAIAQVVSRRCPTAAARVQTRF